MARYARKQRASKQDERGAERKSAPSASCVITSRLVVILQAIIWRAGVWPGAHASTMSEVAAACGLLALPTLAEGFQTIYVR